MSSYLIIELLTEIMFNFQIDYKAVQTVMSFPLKMHEETLVLFINLYLFLVNLHLYM